MEAAAFLPMIILLLSIFEKVANDEPKMALIQTGNYSISSHIMPLLSLLLNAIPLFIDQFKSQKREDTPKIPVEFEGRNPCVDWILVRKKYPGSDCHFYQCELHQPVKPACRLQVIDEEPFPIINPKTVIEKSILVRITNCLSIRIFKCVYGYKYSKESKGCIKFLNNYSQCICPA
ncbi:uncharacterized protein LOC112126966 isoform X2 [Cimex lectularius]|uniref:Uncharacterized protein n=1 Tax=Cimex lectularius TaxID=79782 RepID=A0A8I6STN0_CIMLE|nr:uncharacterized protein LOC112126966 isoform X2 [Cimex lectularius]